jgi:hypothetical protein
LNRYGLDYSVGEGLRARFVPAVLIPRDKLDLTPPITADRLIPEVVTALDVEASTEGLITNLQLNVPRGRPHQAFLAVCARTESLCGRHSTPTLKIGYFAKPY